MTYLLDTGVWIRAVAREATLPPPTLKLLRNPQEQFGLSAISLWEVGKKVQKGKLRLSKELQAWFADALTPNIILLPLNAVVVVDAMRLPNFPNHDPGDELIVATARVHKLTLITTDTKLKNYSHAKISYFKPATEAEEN